MKFTKIVLEKREHVGKITFNRPEVLNCFDRDMLLQIEAALTDIEQDGDIKVGMITGKGKAFCTGHDLKDVQNLPPGPDPLYEDLAYVRKMFSMIEEFPKPTIAVVNGLALAGGLEIVMTCDLAIASEKAELGDHHINFGMMGQGNQMLARIVGERRAKEIIFTGRRVSAVEAERIGLVNRVVPADKLDEAAREMADALIAKNSRALKQIKRLIFQGMQTDRRTAYQLELETVVHYNSTSSDVAQGLKAFTDKK